MWVIPSASIANKIQLLAAGNTEVGIIIATIGDQGRCDTFDDITCYGKSDTGIDSFTSGGGAGGLYCPIDSYDFSV